ncbi:MAG: hypothetical protein Kow0089_23900 [Desulfobulbaceae bacterium]
MKKLCGILFVFGLALLIPLAGFAGTEEDEDVRAFEEMFGKGPQEEDVYRSDRLLVTATGSLKPVHLAPSVATVITAEDIEKTGATTLDEVLETVPGLHVSPSGPSIFTSTWTIRGIHTSINPEVLLLINGVPVTATVEGGRVKTFNMPVAMISRVEVVRGPGSAVHGADAFAGTINVITRDGYEVDGTRAGVRYGSLTRSAGGHSMEAPTAAGTWSPAWRHGKQKGTKTGLLSWTGSAADRRR